MKLLQDYDVVAKIIHWLMAAMIISLLAVGIYMADLPKEDELRPVLFLAHKSFGMTVLFLAFLRLAWRLVNKPPSLDRYSGITRKAAAISHHSLYLLMFLVPIAGYLLTSFHGYAVDYL